MRMFFIHVNGQQHGPYDEATLLRMNLPGNTPVWCKGMPAWLPIAQVFSRPQGRPVQPQPNYARQTVQQPQQPVQQNTSAYNRSTDEQYQPEMRPTTVVLSATDTVAKCDDLSLWGYYKKCWRNYTTFAGRARRKEYWGFTLFNFLFPFCAFFVGLLITALVLFISSDNAAGLLFALPLFLPIYSILSLIYSLAVLIPGLAVISRRLHDIGNGFGYFFLILIPLVGPIILLVFFCTDSEPQQNRFGPNPKTGA